MEEHITKEEFKLYKEKKKEIERLKLKTADYLIAMGSGASIGLGAMLPTLCPKLYYIRFYGLNPAAVAVSALLIGIGIFGSYSSFKNARRSDKKIRKLEREIEEMGLE